MKVIKKVTSWQMFIVIQAIASIVLSVFISKLGALPGMYLLAFIALLAMLLLFTFLLIKPSQNENKGKIRGVIGKIMSILISIVLIVSSFYIHQGDDVLEEVTKPTIQINRFSVFVLKESSFKTLKDLTFEDVGMSDFYDSETHYLEAHNALLNENENIHITKYDDYTHLIEDLYNKKISAIYVNEAYSDMFLEVYETFNDETRIIYSYDITENIIDISKDVDVTQDVFTVFISGIDTRGKVSNVSRSDVNMLVTVNPVTKDILLTSIPRDAYVTLYNKGKKDKLTHAGLAGVENSVKTLENFIGIDINYYARVNFTSLIKMVDALGGISVYSPVSFYTGVYQFNEGYNEMDGEKALAFARERYALGGGDGSRVKNQQRVIQGMLKKAMSPAIITNFTSVLKSIDGTFETNMSSNEIYDLISMQLSDMASWNFHTAVLNGSGKLMYGGAYMPNHKLYYLLVDESSIEECRMLIKKMTNGEKLNK